MITFLSSPLSQQISMTFMTFLGQQIIESVIKYFQSISCYVFGKLSTFNYTTFRTNCTCKAKIFIISTNTTNAQMYYHILSHSNFNSLQWQIYPWKNSLKWKLYFQFSDVAITHLLQPAFSTTLNYKIHYYRTIIVTKQQHRRVLRIVLPRSTVQACI